MPTEPAPALISNDIVGLGLIAATLALIFWAASGPTPLLKKIFAWVPALLLCYFIPPSTTPPVSSMATTPRCTTRSRVTCCCRPRWSC